MGPPNRRPYPSIAIGSFGQRRLQIFVIGFQSTILVLARLYIKWLILNHLVNLLRKRQEVQNRQPQKFVGRPNMSDPTLIVS